MGRTSKSMTGPLNPMYGKTHSEETKRKIAEASRGRERTPAETEVLHRMAKLAIGRKHSDASVELMSENCRKGSEHHNWKGYWSCEGEVYKSSYRAAEALGVSDVTIGNRVRSPNFPTYYIIEDEVDKTQPRKGDSPCHL